MKTALIVDPDIGFGFWLGAGSTSRIMSLFPPKAWWMPPLCSTSSASKSIC